MSQPGDQLLRAADRIRALYADIPYGNWTAGPKDPRPNFDLRCDGRPVVELNWGSEGFALPELLAVLLGAAEQVAALLDEAASVAAGNGLVDDDRYKTEAALARAILREEQS